MAHRLGGYALALLVVSGQFKSHPALQWLEIDLTILAAALVAVFMFVSAVADGSPTKYTLLPFALWTALIPTIATAYPSQYGNTKVITLFTVTLLLAISPFFLLRKPEQRRAFLYGIVAAGTISAVDALTGGAQQPELLGRISAEGADTIGTARLAMAGAIALVVIAISPGTRKRVRIITLSWGGVLAVVALMTGSRGPVLAAALSILVAVALAPAFKKYRMRALGGVVVMGAVALFFVAREGNAGYARILAFLSGETDGSTGARQILWDAAWGGIRQSATGYGWGSFAALGGANSYPHNLLLEVAFEAGVIAAVVVGLVLTFALIVSMRRATDWIGVAFFALLVFSVFNAMVSSDINGSRLLVVVLFATWAVPKLVTQNDAAPGAPATKATPAPQRPLRTR